MRGGKFTLGALTLGTILCAGCVFPLDKPKQGTAVMRSAAIGHPASGELAVAIPTRLIEQHAGDEYLNESLWTHTVSPTSHEFNTLLAANGLRIGIIRGTPPSELQRLMTSEATCINPTIRNTMLGRPKVIPVNGPLEQCSFATMTTLIEEPNTQELQDVECGFVVTATPAPGGKVKLHCEFQVQHGLRQAWLRPSADGSQFARHDQKACESYPSMAFDVILDRDEMLAIGATDDPTRKLGQAFFLNRSGDTWRQRVLIVQAGLSSDEIPGEKPIHKSRSRPVAALVNR
jgi:hypothetical protein